MYKEKKLGLVVAENENEVMWTEVIENTEKDIKNLKKMLKFQEAILEMAKSKIKD